MSKEKQKGDLLEIMIFVLEKSITDNPKTIIRPKYKLKDRDGVLREIDIYVETVVNGKTLKYAFECKNYKKGVQLIHIVDFHSKIADLGIQGYFVTTSNYQKGAIAKASALNIDLLKLKKKEANPEGIKGLISFETLFKVEEIQIFSNVVSPELNISEAIETCNSCKNSIAKVVEEEMLPVIQSQIDKGMEALHPGFGSIKNVSHSIGEEKGKSLGVYATFNKGAQIIHKGTPIPYHLIRLKIRVWHKLHEHKIANVNSFNYIKHNESGLLATFSIAEFHLQNQNMIACITKVEGGDSMFSLGIPSIPETINTYKSVCIGTIDELNLKGLLSDSADSCNAH